MLVKSYLALCEVFERDRSPDRPRRLCLQFMQMFALAACYAAMLGGAPGGATATPSVDIAQFTDIAIAIGDQTPRRSAVSVTKSAINADLVRLLIREKEHTLVSGSRDRN